jgi:hypothetical protein
LILAPMTEVHVLCGNLKSDRSSHFFINYSPVSN